MPIFFGGGGDIIFGGASATSETTLSSCQLRFAIKCHAVLLYVPHKPAANIANG